MFFEVFEIPKIKTKVPTREIDDDGEVCSWYIEEHYPSIEVAFFDLLDLVNEYQQDKVEATKEELIKYVEDTLVKLYEEHKEIKEEVQCIYREIYGENYG